MRLSPCLGLVVVPLFGQLAVSPSAAGQTRVVDDFESGISWTAHPSDGVSLRIASDSGRVPGTSAMRLDFDFHGGAGYAIARRDLDLELPDDYELSLWVRGSALAQNLELKLIDETGENVWWMNRRDFRFPGAWERLVTRKRQIEFAWGPARTPELRRLSALEIAITAGSGGSGTVWIDDIAITVRRVEPLYPAGPLATASSSLPESPAELAVDGTAATAWRATAATPQSLTLDFGGRLEFSGVVLRWTGDGRPAEYGVQISSDGREWAPLAGGPVPAGDADFWHAAEGEARFFRVELERAAGPVYGLREMEVKAVDWAATSSAFFEHVAAASPRGHFPKYVLRTQSYWTVAGVDGDSSEVLINEEGMIEAMAGAFSIEPFLYFRDRLVTWADASTTQRLAREGLPIPSVQWDDLPVPLSLEITAAVAGARDSSTLWVRYRVANRSVSPQDAILYLAVRPFQVNPTWQFLNLPGGVGRITRLEFDDSRVAITTGRTAEEIRFIYPVTEGARFGAGAEAALLERLAAGRLPSAARAADPRGWTAGALAYHLALPAAGQREVWIAVPLHSAAAAPPTRLPAGVAAARGDSVIAEAVDHWHDRLDRFDVALPETAGPLIRSLRSNLAYILINRDGPAIQPGSRSYERSWIRDGSLTSAALLRLGHHEAVREFVEWYAPFQFASGKVPCCVDRRGADPVPEHDSHGQLIFLVAEYWRFTRDTAFAREMWPHVTRAVEHMNALRQTRMTPVYETDSIAYYGLLPESISHEGYSAKPMHSYWDGFFALKGYKDAAELALAIGDSARAAAYADLAADFRQALLNSFARAMADHEIDYLPGSVELGDFDATSTTVGISPGGELANLPGPAVAATFDRYWAEFLRRRDADTAWEAYTPYEHRVVGTFIRLGQPERAHALLDYFIRDRRPAGWNHWAEVVWRDPATPRFIGDMPHTWVGSDFIRSLLDMLAYEREADSTLVVGAGVLPEWAATAPGVIVRDLQTHYGPLSYTMRSGDGILHVRIDPGPRMPPGGIVLRAPVGIEPTSVLVGGARQEPSAAGEIVVRRLPADIVIRF